MAVSEAESVRTLIRESITVTEFYDAPGPMPGLIADAQQRLGVAFPQWLRFIYEACNGFATHTGECILYPLHGYDGVTEFNLFLRGEKWQPSWISRAIVFGYTGGSGSITTHTVALDGELVEWCYNDGEQVRPREDLFVVWKRVEADWNAVIREMDGE